MHSSSTRLILESEGEVLSERIQPLCTATSPLFLAFLKMFLVKPLNLGSLKMFQFPPPLPLDSLKV